MSKLIHNLPDKVSPRAKIQGEAKPRSLVQEMPLAELRQSKNLSQEQIAGSLNVNQATISKLERRTDMFISTLRNFLKAMGGDLEITAHFPEGSVKISQFNIVGDRRQRARKR